MSGALAPVFSETSVRPSFLRTTAVKKPRTEWGCQPVACMAGAMVMPCFRWSIARTRACFESARLGLFDDNFLSDIVEILCSVGVASCAATTEAPHWRESRRGRIPKEPLALYEGGPVTLWSQPKSSPFWINLVGMNWPTKGLFRQSQREKRADIPQTDARAA